MKKDILLSAFEQFNIKDNLKKIKGGREKFQIRLKTDTGVYIIDEDGFMSGPPVQPQGER